MAFTIGAVVFVVFNLAMGAALWFAYRESEQVRTELEAQSSPRQASSVLAAKGRCLGGAEARGNDIHERA